MKCRVGLLQQSRPFSTVYSKREAALESSLQPRSEPSLKAGRPAADRHWSCSCWGTCLFPFQEVNILALSGWDGCQRNVAPLGKWKALLGLLTLPIKLAGIERLHSKQPRVLALLTILLLLLCLVQQNEVESFLEANSDFHLVAYWGDKMTASFIGKMRSPNRASHFPRGATLRWQPSQPERANMFNSSW